MAIYSGVSEYVSKKSPDGAGVTKCIWGVDVTIPSAELTLNATFNLGALPESARANKYWRHTQWLVSRVGATGFDTGNTGRVQLGYTDDDDYFFSNYAPFSGSIYPGGSQLSFGETYPDGDAILKIGTAPASATDVTFRLLCFAFADNQI